MERFNIIQPSIVLAPYVKHYWLLESDDVVHSQRIIPTGNIELRFHKGSLMKRDGELIPVTSLSGQSLSFADLVPTGAVNMIAVVFHPFGARAFFNLPIYELSGLIASADDMNMYSLKELEDKILHEADDNVCIRLIESFLISRLHPFKEYNYRRMVAAINTINLSDGELSVSRLAETVALSRNHFNVFSTNMWGQLRKSLCGLSVFRKPSICCKTIRT